MKVNANQMKSVGKIGLKIGKAIVFEGIKALAIKAAVTAVTRSFDEGLNGVKKLTLDDVVGSTKPKKGFFKGKGEPGEVIDIEATEVTK